MRIVFSSLCVFLLLLFSCEQRSKGLTDKHAGARNNVVNVELIGIDDRLPALHSLSSIYVLGDTLIIHDSKSVDNLIYAYSLKEQKGLGWFGKFGSGPGEVNNFGGLFFDPFRGILYGTDYGRQKVVGYDIRRALVESDYVPESKMTLDPPTRPGIIFNGYYVNDSTLYCRLAFMNNNLAKYDLQHGRVTILGEDNPVCSSQFRLVYFPEKQRFVALGVNSDRIDFLDLEGNQLATVFGPDYTEYNDGTHKYFACGIRDKQGNIYGVYLGKDFSKNVPQDIIVMNSEGDYIKTFHFDGHIWNIAYHEPTNRLYVSTDGEPQFGYINLDDY